MSVHRPTESERMGFEHFPRNSKGRVLEPRQLLDHNGASVDFELLGGLAGRSVLDAGSLDRPLLAELYRFAALLELTEIAAHHPLDGKVVITAFFEASTRTRLSFESAVLRLDGKVLSVPDARVTGVAKGESLADIGEMFNTYGDLVVMRHPETGALDEIRSNLTLPLVNAGNGTGEHPTQALIDWYTLLKWRPSLLEPEPPEEDRIRLCVVGTPSKMRTVRSFLRLATRFAAAIRGVVVVSEDPDPLSGELERELRKAGLDPSTTPHLAEVLPEQDVIYRNSIALLEDGYMRLDAGDRLDASSALKPGCVILHPFARHDELAVELDDTPHNLYFAQAASAVFLRQALLIGLLNRVGSVPQSIRFLAS